MNEKLKQAILECLKEKCPEIDADFWREFTDTPEDALSLHHFGLGLHLRNDVLQPGGDIFELFIREGVRHKDDMSSQMLALWHRELNES